MIKIFEIINWIHSSCIGYVAQKAVLFHGTIEDNIRFGNTHATKNDIEKAARVAQAYDFIMEKPDQFHEMIVEGATMSLVDKSSVFPLRVHC